MTITQATAPTTANYQGEISLSWTVKNQGDSAIQGEHIYDYIYFSEDLNFNPEEDKYIGSGNTNVEVLEVGENYTVTRNLSLPPQVSGTGYLFFVADGTNSLGETDESNNILALPIQVEIPDLDLVVTDFTAPERANISETIDLSWTVKNQGSITAEANWWDEVYLSNDPSIDKDTDIYLDSQWIRKPAFFGAGSNHTIAIPLDGGSSYTVEKSITIPSSSIELGEWYLLVEINSDSNQSENDRTNNTLALPLEIIDAPDLIVSEAIVPNTISSGETITVEVTVENQGSVDSSFSFILGDNNRIYLSEDQQFDPQTDYYLENSIDDTWQYQVLASGDSYTYIKDITIPETILGDRYLFFVTDYANLQTETDESNNYLSIPITITSATDEVPDLVVNSAITPTSAAIGETISVSWTVTNESEFVTTENWYDYIYLSDDTIFDVSDQSLASQLTASQTPLSSGDSYTFTHNVTLPTSVLHENQYLLFIADGSQKQNEVKENNNVYALPLEVVGADLIVSSAQSSISAAIGQNIELSWTVINSGKEDIFLEGSGYGYGSTTGWYDSVYLSKDSSIDSDDILLLGESIESPFSLSSGESYTQTEFVSLNHYGIETGSWNLLFVTDDNYWADNWHEINEQNNTYVLPIEITPSGTDLTVTNAIAPASAGNEEEIEVSWTVTNRGDQDIVITGGGYGYGSNIDWNDSIYLSQDTIFDSEDIYLSGEWIDEYDISSLLSGESYTKTESISFNRRGVIPGNWHLLFVTDRNNDWQETDETNNTYSIPIEIKGSDLSVTQVNSPQSANWNETIDISWQVTNTGEKDILAEGYGYRSTVWLDGVYLSDDEIFDDNDTYLESRNILDGFPLIVGESYTNTASVSIPTTHIGSQYLLFITDEDSDWAETDETNNVVALPIEITAPDLNLIDVVAPPQVGLGETIAISSTITNIGNGEINQNWLDQVYLSTDTILDGNDRVLSTITNTNSLASGNSYTFADQITITDIAIGDYYLIFSTDSQNNQPETDETNNVVTLPIEIVAPDLSIVNVVAPPIASLEETIAISSTITNIGNGKTNQNWLDRVYLSTDTILDNEDRVLSTTTNTNTLAVEDSYLLDLNITITDIAVGDYYLIFDTDIQNNQPEIDETNNLITQPIEIIAPDVAISNITLADTNPKQSNQSLSLSWTVTNQGTKTVEQPLLDRIYISTDGTLTDSILLAEVPYNEIVAIGDSYTANIEVTLPILPDGDYSIIVVTDSNDTIIESNENNNSQTTTLQLRHPNLVPTLTPFNEPVTSNTTVSLPWTIANIGTANNLDSWTDRIYLSDDLVFDSNDLLLGEYQHSKSLSAGENELGQIDWQIPLELNGDYYILLITDADNNLVEPLGEDNNVTTMPITIELAPYADLAVSNIIAPNLTIDDPARIEISWTVTNEGTDRGNQDSWYDRIILSSDEIIGNNDDRIIAQVEHNGD